MEETQDKITGSIDHKDNVAFAKWSRNYVRPGKKAWWYYLVLPAALAAPPLLMYILGEAFDWGTYAAILGVWFVYLPLTLGACALHQRRLATIISKRTRPFEISVSNDSLEIRIGTMVIRCPKDRVTYRQSGENLIILIDSSPFCISPRAGNFSGDCGIKDIASVLEPTSDVVARDPR